MQYTKATFKKEIFLFVVAAHFLCLMLLLFFDKGDFEQERFLIKTNSLASTVVFMPLHKRVPVHEQKSASAESKDKSRKVMSHDAYQKAIERRKKAKKQKKIVSVPKKTGQAQKSAKPVNVEKTAVVKNVDKVKAPTTLHHEKVKAVVEKKAVKSSKVADKKELKKLVEQKKPVSEKKQVEKNQKKEEKKIVQKVPEPKAVVEENPIIEQLPVHEETVPVVQAATVVEDIERARDVHGDDEDENEFDVDDVSFVGRYDLEKYEIEEKIKTVIAKHWKSPICVAKTVTCELGIVVGSDGKALQVDIKKGSGSMAYDMSARAAAYQSCFPKEVCNKTFTIVLGS